LVGFFFFLMSCCLPSAPEALLWYKSVNLRLGKGIGGEMGGQG
jgi:hypothetical protein